MEHYEFELNENFDKADFLNYLSDAIVEISASNGDSITFEMAETTVNTSMNGHVGLFKKYRILNGAELIGYLEAFKNNQSNYLIIYTNPI